MKNKKKSLQELDPALSDLVQHPLFSKTYMSGMVFGFNENGEIEKKDTVKFYNKVSGSQQFYPLELERLNNEFKKIAQFILEKTEESSNNMDIESLSKEVKKKLGHLSKDQIQRVLKQMLDDKEGKYD